MSSHLGSEQLILPTSTLGFPGIKEGFFGVFGVILMVMVVGCWFVLFCFSRQQNYIALGSNSVLI